MVVFKAKFNDVKVSERLLDFFRQKGISYSFVEKPIYIYVYERGESVIEKCKIKVNFEGRDFLFSIEYKSFLMTPEIEILVEGREEDISQVESIFEMLKGRKISFTAEFCNPLVVNRLLNILQKEAKGYSFLEPKFSFDQKERKFTFSEGTIVASFDDGNLKFNISKGYLNIKISVDGTAEKTLEEIFSSLSELEESKEERLFKKIKLSGFSWEDIGGLKELKEELQQVIEWPLKNPVLLKKLGIKAPKGIILYGPPGTGKTLIAKVVACCAEANFFYVTAAELTSMWYGQVEKRVAQLFKEAREENPSLIFIDEFDGLFTARNERMHEATRRMLSSFLIELDGLKELAGVTVLAATNKFEDLDKAIIRPGRFDRIINVPLPDFDARKEIFLIHTKRMPIHDVNFDELVLLTDGLSGAEIEGICQRAAYTALIKYMKLNKKSLEVITESGAEEIKIKHEDFFEALSQNKNKTKNL